MQKTIPLEQGVSYSLAEHRKSIISKLLYKLHFSLPSDKSAAIKAEETISFNWKKNDYPLQIDFKEKTESILNIMVNGKMVPVVHEKEHIIISAKDLKSGSNEIAIQFIAGNLSLNRNADYLYTLLVPDRARTLFPCFDQPNLKACFELSLSLPKEWIAISNAPLKDSVLLPESKRYNYLKSDTISTYVFSFAAGKFVTIERTFEGRKMRFFHRETDSTKLTQSIEPIFQLHQDALLFMEAYTGIAYPFQKLDFIAIPDFQYGGMEHVGAIQYKASSLFLDEGATLDQKIARSNLIAHETAHMWFGNLVTMQWFNDVWMKEVFANFMADKITQAAFGNISYDLKFLLEHYPAAYAVDRTAGANPIRQTLNNLQEAGTLYGNIIYHKAPIVMRQLERLIGKEQLQKGLADYLKQFANSNASWPNLIQILDKQTNQDLKAWNKVWVNETGRPEFKYQVSQEENRIKKMLISQIGEDGSKRIWPQAFEVALVYTDHVEEISIQMNTAELEVKAVEGKEMPLYFLFNSSGYGYGLFPVDERMLLQKRFPQSALMRSALYINLYENMLAGRFVTPDRFIDMVISYIEQEEEELSIRLLSGHLADAYWRFTQPQNRLQLAPDLETRLWQAMLKETNPNKKKILFKSYQNIALTKQALDKLYDVWNNQAAPKDVKLTEDDYTALALTLTVKEYPLNGIADKQLTRINNEDRKNRLKFLLPALSNDVQIRDAFFSSLKLAENREKETWVISALELLHHPLRTNTSVRYLKPSLELLEEIQLTGDIFFPQSWLYASFGGHQSAEAAAIVRSFLKEHAGYNPKLKDKILQATDAVFRAEKLLDKK